MSLAKVLRTRDGRWRVEIRDDGHARLYDQGALILRGTVEHVGQRLADVGVSTEELVED